MVDPNDNVPNDGFESQEKEPNPSETHDDETKMRPEELSHSPPSYESGYAKKHRTSSLVEEEFTD